MLDLSLEASYRVRLQSRDIPADMHESIIRYLVYGVAPGHFLEAVLSNDLAEAVKRCDAVNWPYLADFVRFFYLHAPAEAWGAPEKVWLWIEKHSAVGRK